MKAEPQSDAPVLAFIRTPVGEGRFAEPSPQRGGALVMGGGVSARRTNLSAPLPQASPLIAAQSRRFGDGVHTLSKASTPWWRDGLASTQIVKGPFWPWLRVRR
jgi:hypothetical protein